MKLNLQRYHVAISTTAIVLLINHYLKKKSRRIWTKKWLQRRTDGQNNILAMLNKELVLEDPTSYRNFLRMSHHQFDYILNLISDIIKKNDTNMREAISSRDRLEVAIRFLATGESFRSLMYSTRIHESTISKIVMEVCLAIVQIMQRLYLKTPNTKEEWKKISVEFDEMWQFPNCLGSLDGKHITFKPPISAGSYYFN
ncbi:hypothetical protein ABEB36_014520 [Hypothenemus hampei]|uniref:Nuclease HARBI1 n=1 Tax=Hypothenemus hampei TaxID=57062 RepID=A0ABD1E214_HYPHA